MFEESGPPAPRLNDEAGRWALALLKDLYERAAPRETPDWHYDEVAACFREGKAAMSTDWPGGFYTYEDPETSAVAGSYDVALYPEGRAGRFIYSGCHTFAIPATVRDRPAAVQLLRFLTSRESQAFEAGLERSRRAATLWGTPGPRPLPVRWRSGGGVCWRRAEAALIPPKHENYPAVEDAIWQGVREALLGKDVNEALRDTEEAARRAAESG